MNSRILCVLALAGLLAGCVSGVSRTGTAMPAAQMAPRTPLQSVSLVLTDSGRKDIADNLTFNQDELLSNVKRALDSKGLLVAGAATPGTSAEIQVKSVRVRSTVTAVLFGFNPSQILQASYQTPPDARGVRRILVLSTLCPDRFEPMNVQTLVSQRPG